MSERRLLHYVSLGGPGGVERHCVDFVAAAAELEPQWRHGVLAAGGCVHAELENRIDAAHWIGHEKYAGPFKLPSVPAALRRRRLERRLARTAPDVVVIWNRPVRSREFLGAVAPRRWLHWEHGAAWLPDAEPIKRAYYRDCARIIANSEATRRVLALRWDREAGVELCPNRLRPSLKPARDVAVKKQTPARPFRLGMAGRLAPVKGGALALQALAELVRRGLDVELHVAGDGECRAGLESLARRLGVSASIVWCGHVDAMAAFYAHVDCLVHPSLHESFGLVCLEAAAYGCPVVAADVDGLPEIVRDGVTGLTVAPELPLHEYPGLGGTLSGMPEFVYDPRSDALVAPRLVSPEALADAVARLLEPGKLAELSTGAIETLRERFEFGDHVAAVMNVIKQFADEEHARFG